MSLSTEAYVEQLAEVYRQEIANSAFANRLETGCGPGCGTAEKSSCGTGLAVQAVRSVVDVQSESDLRVKIAVALHSFKRSQCHHFCAESSELIRH